jgi:hypothetical protein
MMVPTTYVQTVVSTQVVDNTKTQLVTMEQTMTDTMTVLSTLLSTLATTATATQTATQTVSVTATALQTDLSNCINKVWLCSPVHRQNCSDLLPFPPVRDDVAADDGRQQQPDEHVRVRVCVRDDPAVVRDRVCDDSHRRRDVDRARRAGLWRQLGRQPRRAGRGRQLWR